MSTSHPVALVTGANRGIGRETVRQLAGKGVAVLLASRDPDRGDAAARELVGEGLRVMPVTLDVTDPATVGAVAALVDARYGRLDILVNNAGAIAPQRATETTADRMRAIFEVNVFGVVTVINTMLRLLVRSEAPRIVNVSSTTASLALTAGDVNLPGNADVRMAYTASKAALNMLTVQYARAFRADPALTHVKVNSATPGYTATDMNQFQGVRRVDEAAGIIVDLALLPADGPDGHFLDDRGTVPW